MSEQEGEADQHQQEEQEGEALKLSLYENQFKGALSGLWRI